MLRLFLKIITIHLYFTSKVCVDCFYHKMFFFQINIFFNFKIYGIDTNQPPKRLDPIYSSEFHICFNIQGSAMVKRLENTDFMYQQFSINMQLQIFQILFCLKKYFIISFSVNKRRFFLQIKYIAKIFSSNVENVFAFCNYFLCVNNHH